MIGTARPSTTQAWILAARPKTLPAAVGPVLVGTGLAIADGVFAWLPALAALLGALLLQIGSNLANDYFDHFKGADTADRLGPVRVTSAGLLTPRQVRAGMLVVFGLAALVGLYLIYVGGWPILAAGAAAILAALAYSGGPLPYGYYGLGELFTFLFFGVVAVCGTYWVQALTLTWPVLLASVPIGCLVTAILVVNNYRDVETDRRAGKRTLAVLLGRRGTRSEYVTLLAVAYLAPVVLLLAERRSGWVLLPLVTLPLAVRTAQALAAATDGPTLNKTLAETARLSMIFGVLFALGLAL
jgi:1,4-dihydroxy-2-naphthoate octaprenyltransferase